MSPGSGEKIETKCYSCGDTIFVTRKEVARAGKKVYCQHCLIDTECRSCGRKMRITHETFSEFDGNPMCQKCINNSSSRLATTSINKDESVLLRRSVAAVIDILLPFFIAAGFEIIMGFFDKNDLAGIPVGTFVILIIVFSFIGNFIEQEAKSGQSLGKALTGIIVIKKDGTSCTWRSSIIRNVLRPIDLIFAYGVGLMFILVTDDNQRFGDYFARTIVVRAK